MDRFIKSVTVACVMLVVITSGSALPQPDSAGHLQPPKGLSYGGIPYGSVSGNVAEYFNKKSAPSIVKQGSYYSRPGYGYE